MTTQTLTIGYHGSSALKAKIVAQMEAHRCQDQIVQGHYWEQDNSEYCGCIIGCLTHDANNGGDIHEKTEQQLGIPEWLARLIERIFEGLPAKDAPNFAVTITKAVPVGFDKWDNLRHDFLAWLLIDSEQGATRQGKVFLGVEEAIKTPAHLHREWCGDTAAAAAYDAYAAAAAAYAADATAYVAYVAGAVSAAAAYDAYAAVSADDAAAAAAYAAGAAAAYTAQAQHVVALLTKQDN